MRAVLVGILGLWLALPRETAAAPTHVPLAVTAVDARGRPVPTLTAADFQVTDRGARVQVVDATWIPEAPPAGRGDAPAGAPADEGGLSEDDEAAAARRPGARIVAIFLDEYHVAPESSASVRAAITGLLRDQVGPQDLVLTVKPLDPLVSLVFHRGNAAALAAVDAFQGRRGDYTARNAFERELIAAEPARIDRARTRIAVAAVQAIVTRLARLGRSRKAVLVVSEGLALSQPRTGRDGDRLTPTPEALVRLASRGNVAISWLDPRAGAAGLPAPGGVAATGLDDVARQTDGHVLRVGDRTGLGAWLADLGGYYLLTLRGDDDGQFHLLDVRTGQAGIRVRTRPGYWAVSREEIARIDRANAPPPPPRPVLPPVRASRLIQAWVGQTRASDGRTRLSVVWEPAPARAGDRTRVLPPSRLVLTAQAADGTRLFEGTVPAASPGIGNAEASFDVPPGRVRLQMSIEDAAARVLDTDVRELVVAPLSSAVSLGTPRVFRTRTAREFAALESDPAAAPVAARAFGRVERLLMRVPVFSAGAPAAAGEVTVTATLLNRMGQTMRRLPVTHRDATGVAVSDLPLAGLAAGEYSVQWRAAGGSAEVLETVSFRVVP